MRKFMILFSWLLIIFFCFAFADKKSVAVNDSVICPVWKDIEVEIIDLKRSKKQSTINWDVIEVLVQNKELGLKNSFSSQFSGNSDPEWVNWKIGDHIPAKLFCLVNEQTGEVKQQIIARIF